MKCVVKSCKNEQRNKDLKKTFFLFPRDKEQLQKWLKFCKNDRTFKPKTWRICNDHFKDEDIYGNEMYKMGYAIKRTLKPGAIPCRYAPRTIGSSLKRTERARRRENKKIVDSLLMDSKKDEDLLIQLSTTKDIKIPACKVLPELESKHSPNAYCGKNAISREVLGQEDTIETLLEAPCKLKRTHILNECYVKYVIKEDVNSEDTLEILEEKEVSQIPANEYCEKYINKQEMLNQEDTMRILQNMPFKPIQEHISNEDCLEYVIKQEELSQMASIERLENVEDFRMLAAEEPLIDAENIIKKEVLDQEEFISF